MRFALYGLGFSISTAT